MGNDTNRAATNFKRSKFVALVMGTTLALASATHVQATGMIAGATEPTQIMNNIELAQQTLKQIEMVKQMIQTVMNTATTVQHGITNLRHMDAAKLKALLGLYGKQPDTLRALNQILTGLKNAESRAIVLMQGAANDAAVMKMSIDTYMGYEKAMAASKGGAYAARLNQDIAAIDDLASRADQLNTFTQRNQELTGNLEGLQLLNSQATMQAGELMEIKAALLAQNADKNQSAVIKQQAEWNQVDVMGSTTAGAKARVARDKATTYKGTDPWSNPWPGVGNK